MVTFSIVVPVYNVGLYLKECLDSVVAQSYSDFEVLLIDDGSKDDSGAICDLYCEKDSRFKVIHKKNAGVSAARNDGISTAVGTYLLFLDSDDYLLPDALMLLSREINTDKCEMYMFGYKAFVNGTEKFQCKTVPELATLSCGNGIDFAAKAVSSSNWLPASAWCVVIGHDYLDAHQFRFDTTLIFGEDADFSLRCLITAQRVRYLPIEVLCFRQQRAGSASTTMNAKHIESSFIYCAKEYQYFIRAENLTLAQYYANQSANAVTGISRIKNKEDVHKLSVLFDSEKKMIFSAVGLKYTVAKIIWEVFGYKYGSNVLQFVNTFRKHDR